MSKATGSWGLSPVLAGSELCVSPAQLSSRSWFAFLQDKNAAAPSAKKKENKVLKEVVARGATAGPRAKAAALPGAGGSKTVSAPPVRRPEAPKGPRRPGMPTKASSSKLASKKTEAES